MTESISNRIARRWHEISPNPSMRAYYNFFMFLGEGFVHVQVDGKGDGFFPPNVTAGLALMGLPQGTEQLKFDL